MKLVEFALVHAYSDGTKVIISCMSSTSLRSSFYQKCYDPECKAAGYKSPALELPLEICDVINGMTDQDFPAETDDEDMVRACKYVEDEISATTNSSWRMLRSSLEGILTPCIWLRSG